MLSRVEPTLGDDAVSFDGSTPRDFSTDSKRARWMRSAFAQAQEQGGRSGIAFLVAAFAAKAS